LSRPACKKKKKKMKKNQMKIRSKMEEKEGDPRDLGAHELDIVVNWETK